MPTVETTPFPNKTRVRVIGSLSGVPEGSAGSVQGTVGFAIARHRVAFDNGRFVTSVARTRLVRELEWDEFVTARDEEAAAEAARAAAPAPAAETPAEKPAEAEGGAAPVDDRLAALAAKSKAAREKKAAGG